MGIFTPITHTANYLHNVNESNKQKALLGKQLLAEIEERKNKSNEFLSTHFNFETLTPQEQKEQIEAIFTYQLQEKYQHNISAMKITDDRTTPHTVHEGNNVIEFLAELALKQSPNSNIDEVMKIVNLIVENAIISSQLNAKNPSPTNKSGEKTTFPLFISPTKVDKAKIAIPHAIDVGTFQAMSWQAICTLTNFSSFYNAAPSAGSNALFQSIAPKGEYDQFLAKRLAVSSSIDLGLFVTKLLHNNTVKLGIESIKAAVGMDSLSTSKRKELSKHSVQNLYANALHNFTHKQMEQLEGFSQNINSAMQKVPNLQQQIAAHLTMNSDDALKQINLLIEKLNTLQNTSPALQNAKKMLLDFKKNFGKTYEGGDEFVTNYSHLFEPSNVGALSGAIGVGATGLLAATLITGVTCGTVQGIKKFQSLGYSESTALIERTTDSRNIKDRMKDAAKINWAGTKSTIKNFGTNGHSDIAKRLLLRTIYFDSWASTFCNTGAAEIVPSAIAAARNTSQNYFKAQMLDGDLSGIAKVDEQIAKTTKEILMKAYENSVEGLETKLGNNPNSHSAHSSGVNLLEAPQMKYPSQLEIDSYIKQHNPAQIADREAVFANVTSAIKKQNKVIKQTWKSKEMQALIANNNVSLEEVTSKMQEIIEARAYEEGLQSKIGPHSETIAPRLPIGEIVHGVNEELIKPLCYRMQNAGNLANGIIPLRAKIAKIQNEIAQTIHRIQAFHSKAPNSMKCINAMVPNGTSIMNALNYMSETGELKKHGTSLEEVRKALQNPANASSNEIKIIEQVKAGIVKRQTDLNLTFGNIENDCNAKIAALKELQETAKEVLKNSEDKFKSTSEKNHGYNNKHFYALKEQYGKMNGVYNDIKAEFTKDEKLFNGMTTISTSKFHDLPQAVEANVTQFVQTFENATNLENNANELKLRKNQKNALSSNLLATPHGGVYY